MINSILVLYGFSWYVWTVLLFQMPHQLARLFPHLIHVEESSLVRPNWQEDHLLFRDHYNWSSNYAVHVWHRRGYVPPDPTATHALDNTLGELMRFVYYNDKSLISDGTHHPVSLWCFIHYITLHANLNVMKCSQPTFLYLQHLLMHAPYTCKFTALNCLTH